MKVPTPTETVLYSIERAIKEYRKFSQSNVSNEIKDITVDQTLTLILINKNPEITQMELAKLIFKDYASITRIIELMVKKDFLKRKINEKDRRRFKLEITKKGKSTIKKLTPTIELNRSTALDGFKDKEILQLQSLLERIISNCTK